MFGNQSASPTLRNDTSYVDNTRSHLLIINGQEATDREYARVMNAQPSAWTAQQIAADQEQCTSRPFRFFR